MSKDQSLKAPTEKVEVLIKPDAQTLRTIEALSVAKLQQKTKADERLFSGQYCLRVASNHRQTT